MNPNLLFMPWKTYYIMKIFTIGTAILFLLVYYVYSIVAINKNIRMITYEKTWSYIITLNINIVWIIYLLWYVSIPLSIIATISNSKYYYKELNEFREMGLRGGWSSNAKFRKKQIEDFKLKTPEEQNKEIDFYKNFSTKLNPVILSFTVIIPIIIILILWVSGVGYRTGGTIILK